MSTQSKDKALRQAAALLRLAKSDNAHEATQAAMRAQEIMSAHALTEAMLNLDGAPQEPDEDVVDFASKGAPLDTGSGRRNKSTWRARLAIVVSRANGCYTFTSGPTIQIVGRPSDVDVVRYLYAWVSAECDRLAKIEGAGCGKAWSDSYRNGFCDGVEDAFKKARDAAAQTKRLEVQASGANAADRVVALVRVDDAFAKLDAHYRRVEADTFKTHKLRTWSSRSSYNPAARNAGRKAGQNVDVGGRPRKAIGGGS